MKRDETQVERIADELQFLEGILDKINKEEFLQNALLQHAVMMSLLTMGECARRLSDEFKEENAHIAWAQIVAVRNITAHGYWQLNMEQVWQALIEDIPILRDFIDHKR